MVDLSPGWGASNPVIESADLGEKVGTWFRAASKAAPGSWGVAIADRTGQLLWGVNATQPMIPASTVKVFTTGFARSVVGSDARQRTRIIGSGQVSLDGTWLGTWAIEVNGDVTLERADRGGPSLYDLALQLSVQGIRRLTGPLVLQSAQGVAQASWPSTWASRHQGRLFAPLVGPLTLNENTVSFQIAPGAKAGQAPYVVASSPSGLGPLVTVQAHTVAGNASKIGIRAQSGGRYLVTGTIGVRARPKSFTGTSNDPRSVLEAAWNDALGRAGIEWIANPALASADLLFPSERRVLAEVASASFDSVASEVNRRSLNLGAELLLQWAAGTERAAQALTDHVRRITGDPMGVTLVDGSGLSSEDRASASSFVSYLARFPESAGGRNFAMLLPANGEGTLRRLITGFPGQGVLRAKTGTLGNAATLVGYLGQSDGVLLISLLYNGPNVYTARQQQWKLLRLLGANGMVIAEDTLSRIGDDS